jgi:hypothetical protein
LIVAGIIEHEPDRLDGCVTCTEHAPPPVCTVGELLSVTATFIPYVPDVGNAVDANDETPIGAPPVVHEYWRGEIPPLTTAVQVVGCPAVTELGKHEQATGNGCAPGHVLAAARMRRDSDVKLEKHAETKLSV